MTDPLARIANTYLINEFHLKISPSAASLWQLAEYPFTIRILRNIAATLSVICLLLLLLLILTIWAARRWVTRSLSIDQKKAIVQEILDNECRLMLTARLRAAVNKERLLPLILQEHRRLELMDRYLRGLLGEQTDAITPEAGAEENGIGGFSAFANKIVALGRDFRFNLGERCRKPTASPSLVQPTFSPAGTENMGPRRSERASNCRWPVDHDRINMLRSIMKSPRPNTDTESSGQPPTQNTNAPTKSTSPPARVELISPQEQKRKPAAIEKRRVVRPSTVRSQHQSLLGREGSEVKAQSQQPSQQLQYLQLPRRMNPQGQLRAKGQNVRRRSTGAAVRNIRDPS
ncbi:unnamed protein product [Calicophoron daubneyi]|uniref:Uncharacterized protein n=1 Tax=Calicophoron daubneyi TaxID=300641 RepID=A0AAV2T2T5_CALDB